jgi:hypothetical protein
MNKRILPFFFVLIALSTKGQDTFEKYYDAAGTATLKLNELASGNVFVGMAFEYGTSIVNAQGSVLHSKCYAVDTMLVIQSVKKISNNEFYFGSIYAQGLNAPDPGAHPLLGKMDSLGNVTMLNYYHLNVGANIGNAIGDLEVVSHKGVIGWDRDNRLMLLRADSNLMHIWSRAFDQEGVFHFTKELPSGDLLVGFELASGGASLMRTDANGNILWCKSYFRPDGRMHDAVIESDTSFVVVGYSPSPGQKVFLMNVNGNGDVLWCLGYNTVQPWNGLHPQVRIVKALDDNYVLLLSADRPWLLKTDLNGDTLWSRRFGVNAGSYSTADLLATADGGYMFDGEGYPWGMYIFKTDSLGHLPCSEAPPAPLHITQLFPVDSNITLTSVDGAVTYPAYALATMCNAITTLDGCTITSTPNPVLSNLDKPRIRPNPTTGRITVQFTDPLTAESYYSVYDTMGRLLYQRPLPQGQQTEEVDLSRFGQGTYVLKFTSPEGVCFERVVLE